jgi:hypothetical protein
MRSNSCLKCHGSMSEGFVTDSNYSVVSWWVEGVPKLSFVFGLMLGRKAKLKIQMWRCSRCGFLESYAKD